MILSIKNHIKNLGADNSYLKIFSLFLMFLSASIFAETIGFICRDPSFLDYFLNEIYNNSPWLSSILVRQFFLFGPGVRYGTSHIFWGFTSICIISFILFFITFYFYKKNIKTETIFHSFIKYLNNKLPLEIVLLLVFISIKFDKYSMHRKLYMYDKFVFYDIFALYLIYFMINYMVYNKNHLFNKLYTSSFIKTLINKHNKKSLNKKLAYTLFWGLILQCVLLLVLFATFDYNFMLIFIFYIFITFTFYIFVFKLICNKFDYIEYISKEVESIKNASINCELQIKGSDQISLLAKNINNMNEGLTKAVDEQLKVRK